LFLGIFEGHFDPAVAIVEDGKVLAFAEEERHLRNKHAYGFYPYRALKYCLDVAKATIEDIEAVGINWNLPAYTNGTIRDFFQGMRDEWPVDNRTIAFQEMVLRKFNQDSYRAFHEYHWRVAFGDRRFPPLAPFGHHFVHAFQACLQSPFERSLCVTVDGSGDQHCTVLWVHEGSSLRPLREIRMPHSLGWVYAAFTEYLGFEAYDGEYKVMGLAAYGGPNDELRSKVSQIVRPAADGIGYCVDPTFIHYGAHSYSGRFTDKLNELFGRPPRLKDEPITRWHEDLAYAVQENLEDSIERLVAWGMYETGIRNVCLGGGVALNIKMNSRLFLRSDVDDVFPHPLCSDSGAAAGAALAACFQMTGSRPERLTSLALGLEQTSDDIEQALRNAWLEYERPADICAAAALELANGRVVGWFQGRMEAGPRALGQRSILADPRSLANRDRVNAVIKFREYWRPFCPSMTAAAADRYFAKHTSAPFMILAFPANERLSKEAPAIVHVDGTSRVQFVEPSVLPKYHRLLEEFEKLTGVPVLLNTSFNVKGEPIVCTIHDALRTFWSTGMEVLVAGDFIVRKPRAASA
jgi:carbamoyltransferase